MEDEQSFRPEVNVILEQAGPLGSTFTVDEKTNHGSSILSEFGVLHTPPSLHAHKKGRNSTISQGNT